MTLPREEVSAGVVAQYAAFEDLLRSLGEPDLDKATRCEGWTVRNVASHVVGILSDVTAGRFDDLGTPEATARHLGDRTDATGQQLADELGASASMIPGLLAIFDDGAWNGPGPANTGTLGDGVEALWYDTYIHGDDIADALGRDSARGDGLKASVAHVAMMLDSQGWRPATLALDGMPRFDVSGGGEEITGDPYDFVMAATGRRDPKPLGLDETVNIYR